MGNEISSENIVSNGKRTNDRMSIAQIWDEIKEYSKQIQEISGASQAWKWIEILRDRASELEEECVLEKHYPEKYREQVREYFKNKASTGPVTEEEAQSVRVQNQIKNAKKPYTKPAIETYERKPEDQNVEVDCTKGPLTVEMPPEPQIVGVVPKKLPEIPGDPTFYERVEQFIRPTWDQYFITVVNAIAQRATCDRGRSGCVVTKDNQILSAGYVGSPRGFEHCDDAGHLIEKVLHPNEQAHSLHCVRTVHAEMNAICQAARRGISLEGATLYSTMMPCRTCAMHLIQCGISRVVSMHQYQKGLKSVDMFLKAGIEVDCINDKVFEY